MSADTTVAILVTRGITTSKYQYRVALVQAIENITEYELDYPENDPKLNRKQVLMRFGDAVVEHDEWVAREKAAEIEREIIEDGGVVEYGVKILDFSGIPFPPST